MCVMIGRSVRPSSSATTCRTASSYSPNFSGGTSPPGRPNSTPPRCSRMPIAAKVWRVRKTQEGGGPSSDVSRNSIASCQASGPGQKSVPRNQSSTSRQPPIRCPRRMPSPCKKRHPVDGFSLRERDWLAGSAQSRNSTVHPPLLGAIVPIDSEENSVLRTESTM